MHDRATIRWILAMLLAGLLPGIPATCRAEEGVSPEAQQVKRILQTTGVRGGLVVHVGCGDGNLATAMASGPSFLVLGLDANAENVANARNRVQEAGLAGKVSIRQHNGPRLPLVDNLVRLLVVERSADVPREEMLRVLAPGGVAYMNSDGRWAKTVKPWPAEIDEWTHYLHDAGGNAVARDTRVGPPRHIQWMGAPIWTRNHHKLASISSVVSGGGRIFYILDEASAALMDVPGKWSVVGRDAFNGVLLWQRSIPKWAWHQRGFRSGPVQLPRTLVAGPDCVYVPLGLGAPVSALDPATGAVVRTYGQTDGAEEIILCEGVLLVVTGSPTAEHALAGPKGASQGPFPNEKSIVAIRAASVTPSNGGETLWKWNEPAAGSLMPLTLAAAGPRVFFQVGKGVVCLDRDKGNELWSTSPKVASRPEKKPAQPRKPGKKPKSNRGVGWSVATLVVHDGVVLSTGGGSLAAMSATEGKPLWECRIGSGFRSPPDVFVVAGLAWLGPGFTEGRDLHTGEVKKTSTAVADVWTTGHHHRCYREKATERYILTGKRGIEFLDLEAGSHTRNNWIRGTCQYGIMPSGGLIYAPSHACGCFMEAKLYGFWAVAAKRKAESRKRKAETARLERGPAYTSLSTPHSPLPTPSSWPTLRHDPLRSGSTSMEVPMPLADVWQADIGGRLSAPVAAEGTVLVSSIDTGQVFALDADTGKTRWTFTVGGRVDSPPTIYRGLALAGCADGWVYCLRLADGELVWRFRAAAENLNTVALDQVESVWPVHGSVLVQNGVAYFAAGRSSYLDGGIYLFGLDPATGKVLSHRRVCSEHPTVDDGKAAAEFPRKGISQNATDYKTFTHPDRSDAFSMAGVTSDVMVGDGTSVFLRHLRFDRQCVPQEKKSRHLFSTSRLLDGAENHRSHWVLGTGDFSRTPVAYSWIVNGNGGWGVHLAEPHGVMLSFDEQTVWGVRRGDYSLYARASRPLSSDDESLPDFRPMQGNRTPDRQWSVQLPLRPRAMLRAGKHLVLGGMPLASESADLTALYEGLRGGRLVIVATNDGAIVAQQKLASPPVWDGLAAADGRLYVATADGKLLCFGGR